MKALELTGTVFGKLTVIESAITSQKGRWWRCQCACGNEVIAKASILNAGKRRSCGCASLTWFRGQILPDNLALWRKTIIHYKTNAKKRYVTWELVEPVAISLLKGDCHYCNAIPSNPISSSRGDRTILVSGIDRVDNKLGYVVGNVVSCCKNCNLAKRDRYVEEFIAWAHRISAHLKDHNA